MSWTANSTCSSPAETPSSPMLYRSGSPKGTEIMHEKTSNHHGRLNRRSFLDAAGTLAAGGLALGATFATIRPSCAWGQQLAKETHPSSTRVLDRLKTRFSFQISVD